jgi:hypothetical protein
MSKIALLPGGFKPPHAGHYNMAKWLSANTGADTTIIFVGPKERDGITQEMSLKLWKIYTQNDSGLEVRPAGVSPVRDVYDFVEQDAPEGSTVFLGMGEKDINDKRYANIGKFAEPRNIKYKPVVVPPQAGGVSGTDVRKAIKNNDKALFQYSLPEHLSNEQKEQAWSIVTGLKENIEDQKSITINYKAEHINKGFIKVKDLEETEELFPLPDTGDNKIKSSTKDFKGTLISTNDQKLNAFKNKTIIINNLNVNSDMPGKKFAMGPTPEEFIGGKKPSPINAELINIEPSLKEDFYDPRNKYYDFAKSSEWKAGMPDGHKDDIPRAYKYKRGGLYTGGGMGFGGMYEADEKGKILHAYDFDDTIAQVKANIRTTITSPKGDYKKIIDIPSDKFPEVSKEMEAKFSMMDFDYNFSEFEKQIGDAIVNSKVVNKLKASLSNPQIKTTILTARTIGHPVTKFLKKMGLDAYVVPLGLQVSGERVTGKDKADWIENHIKKGYQTVYFIDDSAENRIAVAALKDKYPDVNITVEDPAAVSEMLGMMTEPEKKKHAKNMKRLSKDMSNMKGNNYGGGGYKVPNYVKGTLTRKLYEEMSAADLDSVETYADDKLDPIDVEFTNHFFNRVNDPRNKKDISGAELIGFFKRLSKNKKSFIEFLKKYKEVVATDNRTNLNIPFVNQANKAIAKTVMRKKDFQTSNPQLSIGEEEAGTGELYVYDERKLSDKEEKIAQDLPDKEFKKRYGKDWKSVKIATATKMAKKENTFTKEWWKEIISEILLTEGGAAGHMAHPFNLPNVNNGKDLLDIFEKSAESLNKNPGAIKIDGVNASIRLVDLDGKKQFVMDRGSKKALDIKGITKADLEDRFKTKDGSPHGMVKTGGEVLDLFNEALPSIKGDLEKLGAYDNPNILFNMEYVSGKTNVQEYGSNFIAIHGLNKIESKEVQGKRKMLTKRVSSEISYDKTAFQSLLDNLKPIAEKRGYEVYGSVPTKMTKKPNFNSALSKNYTINAGESSDTKSLGQWLSELSDIPETDFIFMNVGYKADSSTVNRKKVGAVSKQVYLAILNKENIDGLFDDAEDRKKAVQGFVTYLATEKLGDEVLKVLDSPMGSADNHEGVVIRDENIANVPFKITGKFILGGMQTGFR